MGKYLVVYKNSLSSFMQYRLNLSLIIVGNILSLSGLICLWLAVYSSGQKLGNYTLEGIIIYYVLIVVIRTLSEGIGMGFEVIEDINRGEVVHYLLKPFSYALKRFFELLGQVTINVIFITPVVLALAYFGRSYLVYPDWLGWIKLFIACGLVVVLEYLIYFFISLFSFWLQRSSHLVYGMLLVSGILNGAYLPLDLFPDWAFKISHYLPFQFLVFFPIQVFLGRVNNWLEMFLIATGWIIILILLISLVWKRGIKRFEAVGR